MQNTLHRNPYFLFPNLLKRWYFWKNCAGIWSFLYYRGRWYFFFPKIWSYTQTENERWLSQKKKKKKKKYTEIYFLQMFWKDGLFKKDRAGIWFLLYFRERWYFSTEKMVFFPGRKTRERGRQPSSRNTRKHGIFYLICSTPPCQKGLKMILSRKNTPKGDWHSWLTP